MQDVQGTLFDLFAIAKLGFREKHSNVDNPRWHWQDQRALTCLWFLDKLATSPLGSGLMSDHIHYIRRMDERTRRLLKGTMLASELSVAFCHIVSAAHDLLEHGKCDRHAVRNLQLGSELLVSRLDS